MDISNSPGAHIAQGSNAVDQSMDDGSGVFPVGFPNDSTRIGSKDDVITESFVCLASKTHDISLAEKHTTIERLGEDLESAVKAVWPRGGEVRYLWVDVLLISWATDDLEVDGEIKALRHVFEDMYGFHCQTYKIPDRQPEKALMRVVLDFLEQDNDNTRYIAYYAGHARRPLLSNEATLWYANRTTASPFLSSAGIQSLLENTVADVLLLYDCCQSAVTATTGFHRGNIGAKEAIAACGYETVAAEAGEHSFTKALTETLVAASKGFPFSVGELHARVLSRLICWTPNFDKDEKGKYKEGEDGRLQLEHQPRKTPIYSVLCESKLRRNIILAPLRRAIPVVFTPSQIGVSGSSAGTSPASYADSSTANSKKRKRSAEEETKWPQVVLSVRLGKDDFEIPTWKEWIRSIPAEAKDIKVEGVYKSFSTLLLVRMPVAVWDMLPENEAYSFVGFIMSENLAFKELHRMNSAEASSQTLYSGHSWNLSSQVAESPDEAITALSEDAFWRPEVGKIPDTISLADLDLTQYPVASSSFFDDAMLSSPSAPLISTSEAPAEDKGYIGFAGPTTDRNIEAAKNPASASRSAEIHSPPVVPTAGASSKPWPSEGGAHHVHRHGYSAGGTGSSHRSAIQYDYDWVWSCCSCGIQGGMTVDIQQCPDCAHVRCADCPVQQIKLPSHR